MSPNLENYGKCIINADSIRQRLSPIFHYGPEISGCTFASVMVLIQERENESVFIMIERAFHLRFHPGEMAFPGGKREPTDASPAETAIREVGEELTIPSTMIEVIGALPEVTTHHTGFVIVPIVAFLNNHFKEFQVDKNEVSDVLAIPVKTFLIRPIVLGPKYYFLKGYRFADKVIWGATAGMIRNFLSSINLTLDT